MFRLQQVDVYPWIFISLSYEMIFNVTGYFLKMQKQKYGSILTTLPYEVVLKEHLYCIVTMPLVSYTF